VLVDEVGHLEILEMTAFPDELRARMWNSSGCPGEGGAGLVDDLSVADHDEKRSVDFAECGFAEYIREDGPLLVSEVSQAGGHDPDEPLIDLDVRSERLEAPVRPPDPADETAGRPLFATRRGGGSQPVPEAQPRRLAQGSSRTD